jgi:hypothetical protein
VAAGIGSLLVMSCCCAGCLHLAIRPARVAVAKPSPAEREAAEQPMDPNDPLLKGYREGKLTRAIAEGIDELDARTMKTGDVGRLDDPIRIIQVISDTSVLGEVHGVTLLVDNLETAGLVDGRQWDPRGHGFEVGTYSYVTVAGGSRTVIAVRRFDARDAIREGEEERERRRARMP